MQLHELKHFEHAFKFEQPEFRQVMKEDLDEVTLTMVLVDGRDHDLVNLLITLDTHLCHKALIVLMDVEEMLLGSATAVNAPLFNSKLETGETILCHPMLHL